MCKKRPTFYDDWRSQNDRQMKPDASFCQRLICAIFEYITAIAVVLLLFAACVLRLDVLEVGVPTAWYWSFYVLLYQFPLVLQSTLLLDSTGITDALTLLLRSLSTFAFYFSWHALTLLSLTGFTVWRLCAVANLAWRYRHAKDPTDRWVARAVLLVYVSVIAYVVLTVLVPLVRDLFVYGWKAVVIRIWRFVSCGMETNASAGDKTNRSTSAGDQRSTASKPDGTKKTKPSFHSPSERITARQGLERTAEILNKGEAAHKQTLAKALDEKKAATIAFAKDPGSVPKLHDFFYVQGKVDALQDTGRQLSEMRAQVAGTAAIAVDRPSGSLGQRATDVAIEKFSQALDKSLEANQEELNKAMGAAVRGGVGSAAASLLTPDVLRTQGSAPLTPPHPGLEPIRTPRRPLANDFGVPTPTGMDINYPV